MDDKSGISEAIRSRTPSAGSKNEVYLPPIPEVNWKMINPYEDSAGRINERGENNNSPKPTEEDPELIKNDLYNRVYRCYKNWGIVFSILLIVM